MDALARQISDVGLPHPLLVDAAREAIAAGDPESAHARARATERRALTPVINATGVLLHTNLGRAPLDGVPGQQTRIAGYNNLELDLESGTRGSRQDRTARLLARACGAEDAIVVNNCASAVLLSLAAVADGGAVVVSRGELVEIGGGFRVPDVMAQSGARLVEIGTTNRTRADDYARAVAEHDDAVAVLQVHRSNYRIVGFTESPTTDALAALGVPLIVDLGSGLLDATCPWLTGPPPAWLADEPAARQTLDAGAGLVLFSGDKLLGGPQAGIIAGSRDLVARCAAHPLARAVRPGGLVLGALQQTALDYLDRRGDRIPFWQMATTPVQDLRGRAAALLSTHDLPEGWSVADTSSVPGGGTLPGVEIPSAGLQRQGDHTALLRMADPPVIARVEDDTTICDLRAIPPELDEALASALAHT